MNEANVKALAAAIRAITNPLDNEADPDWLAEQLASHGVLVPGALTDEECQKVLEVGKTCVMQDDPLYDEDAMRADLDRIAKGEP